MKAERIYSIILVAALLCLCANGYAEETGSFPPLPEALSAMESDDNVTVNTVTVPAWGETENYYYAFQDRFKKPTCGFIFYPGALVDPRAYAPSMREIAEAGYLSVIVKMPGDLAFYSFERATDVIADNPLIKSWVIGGHSLGATSACIYVYENLDKVKELKLKGLAVWASTADPARPITDFTGKVLLIYGTNDGAATLLGDSKNLLPADTRQVIIQGGNHTFCGWYGDNESFVQPGDGKATIAHTDQQAQLDNATLVLLDEVSGRHSPCPVVSVLGRDDPAVAMLRQFRDTMLAQSAVGRKVIQLYYNNAGSISAALERSPALSNITRRVLEVIAPMVRRN
jgi:hypothetical protein